MKTPLTYLPLSSPFFKKNNSGFYVPLRIHAHFWGECWKLFWGRGSNRSLVFVLFSKLLLQAPTILFTHHKPRPVASLILFFSVEITVPSNPVWISPGCPIP